MRFLQGWYRNSVRNGVGVAQVLNAGAVLRIRDEDEVRALTVLRPYMLRIPIYRKVERNKKGDARRLGGGRGQPHDACVQVTIEQSYTTRLSPMRGRES